MKDRFLSSIAYVTLISFISTLSPLMWAQPYKAPPAPEIYELALQQEEAVKKEPPFAYTVTPGEEHFIEYGDVQLEIPAGAVKEETVLTIEKLDRISRLNDGLENATREAAGYRFGPHPFEFEKNIRVTLPYEERVNRSQASLSDLQVWFYNEEHKCWEGLPVAEVKSEENRVTGLTNHFTDMITGTLTMPESPNPINFDPNSIKELEAANPAAGVPGVEGLEPSPMGGGSFSIPLNLPRGRGNGTPSLNLSYNVNSSNSWMGRGFDISVPSITTDSKFGLPDYDGEDTYLLAGEKLIKTSAGSTGVMIYEPRLESAFSQIIRHRGTSDGRGPDYWEIKQKNGTVQYYGGGNAYAGPGATQVFTWYLKETVDANGNRVIYKYDNTDDYTYLEEICWSGHGANEGPYRVVFNHEGGRGDVRTDGRGKYISRLKDLLTGIDIYYNTENFRSYRFHYEENLFGQNQLVSYDETDGGDTDVLYSYGFDYHELDAEGDGYTAFEHEVWGNTNPLEFNELTGKSVSSNASGSLGANLGMTLGVYWLSFDFWSVSRKLIVNLSASAGLNYTWGWQNSNLMDLDGNGLPDLVWQEKSIFGGENMLVGLNNTGSGFSGETNVDDLEKLMSQNSQFSYNLGVSASALGLVEVGINYQNTASDQTSSFSDVDGDGYVDVILRDKDYYLQNQMTPEASNSSFEKSYWKDLNGKAGDVPRLTLTPEEKESYRKSYYIESPVKRWHAYREGTVDLNHTLSLVNDDPVADVEAIMDYSLAAPVSQPGQDIEHVLVSITENFPVEHESIKVDREGEIFFVLNPGEEIVGEERDITFKDDINWSTRISYSDISLFKGERVREGSFDLDNTLDVKTVSRDKGRFVPYRFLESHYDKAIANGASSSFMSYAYDEETEEYGEDETRTVFLLKDNVKSNGEIMDALAEELYPVLATFTASELNSLAALGSSQEGIFDISDTVWAKENLARTGKFIPARLMASDFRHIYENDLASETDKAVLQFLYRYDEWENAFILKDLTGAAAAEEYLRSTMEKLLPLFSEEELLGIAFTTFDDESVIWGNDACISTEKSYEGDKTFYPETDTIIHGVEGSAYGSDKILLDRLYSDKTDNSEFRDFVLIDDSIVREYDKDGTLVDEYIATYSNDTVAFSRFGVTHNSEIAFAQVPERINAPFYDTEVRETILGDNKVSLFPHREITAAYYNTLTAELITAVNELEEREEAINGVGGELEVLRSELADLESAATPDETAIGLKRNEILSKEAELLEVQNDLRDAREDLRPYEDLYKNEGGVFVLQSPEEYPEDYHSDYQILLTRLQDDVAMIGNSIFYEFAPGAGTGTHLGFLVLSQIDMDNLDNIEGLPVNFIHTENELSYIDPDYLIGNGDSPRDVLEQYRAYMELFDYYQRDGEFFTLSDGNIAMMNSPVWTNRGAKNDLTAAVSIVLAPLDVKVPGHIRTSYIYPEDISFQVDTKTAASGESLKALPVNFADESYEIADDEAYDYISVIRTDTDRSFVKDVPIHTFDSIKDYSVEDLPSERFDDEYFSLNSSQIINPGDLQNAMASFADDAEVLDRDSCFAGGVRNWGYGFWSYGYAGSGWDVTKIGEDTNPNTTGTESSDASHITADDIVIANPPRLVPADQNMEQEHETDDWIISVPEEGNIPRTPLKRDNWIGTVSDYSTSKLDMVGANVETTYINNSFTPYMGDTGRWHAMRKGGPTYYESLAYDKPASSGSGGDDYDMEDFQKSSSEGIGIRGGLTIGFDGYGVNGGVSKSVTNNISFGTRSFMDINGDRFPDLITKDKDGDMNAFYGSPDGFTDSHDYNASFDRLNFQRNQSRTFGYSITPGGQSENTLYSPWGIPKASWNVTDYGPNAEPLGFGLSGTKTESQQVTNLMDINGDGLPDHVNISDDFDIHIIDSKISESVGDNYAVRLNTGNDFDSSDSWNDFNRQSLSDSVTGSLGGNVSIGASYVGITGGLSGNLNMTEYQLMDINGDGLPDQVEKISGTDYFTVRFNRGSSFSDHSVKLYCPEWQSVTEKYFDNVKDDLTEKLKIDINGATISLGEAFDIDGILNSNARDFLNPFTVHDSLTSSTGLSVSLGAGVNLSYDMFVVAFTVSVGVNGALAESKTSVMMRDMNGDGTPEHIYKDPSGAAMYLRVNKMADVGLLTGIELPQGGRYDLEYLRTNNTQQDPHSRLCLSKVTKSDGYLSDDDSTHSYSTSYSYGNARYQRFENRVPNDLLERIESREFYGFDLIRVDNSFDDSYSETVFDNSTYAMKGKTLEQRTYDADQNLVSQKIIGYQSRLTPSGAGLFIAPAQETVSRFEPGVTGQMETVKTYTYDSYGNVTSLTSVITGAPETQNYHLALGYEIHDTGLNNPYFASSPNSLEAYWGRSRDDSRLLRKRTADYDNNTGNLTELTQFYLFGEGETTTFTYDDEGYGNIVSVTGPTGYKMLYGYDGNNQFVTSIQSGRPGNYYTSSMTWYPQWGQMATQTEINDNTMTWEYDSFGRLSAIKTDYDDSIPAVSYTYHTDPITDADPGAFPWRAVTSNKVSFDDADTETIETVVTVDGLGRITQTAKEGVVYDPDRDIKERGWNRSGAIWYDSKARPIKEGQTQFQPMEYSLPLARSQMPDPTPMVNPTTKVYDSQGRISDIILPGPDNEPAVTMHTAYSLGNLALSGYSPVSNSGETHQIVTQTDPEGNRTVTYRNGRGHIAAIVKIDDYGVSDDRPSRPQRLEMSYQYNLLGELLRTRDMRGNEVFFEYDLLGRTTRQVSPDAGVQEFTYEDGLLKYKKDSNLIAKGKSIEYAYDAHNRLEEIIYPFSDNVVYTYGTSDGNNALGRLESVTNGTTNTSYEYGLLGEITGMTRTIDRMTPLSEDLDASFAFTSDYLGRMEKITYPDREELTYEYDKGGQIISAGSTKPGIGSFSYVKDIGYDQYGQRVYMTYNDDNGITTRYEYDEHRRWLKHLETVKSDQTTKYQDIAYTFDKVGNILKMENLETQYHSTEQEYTYDGFYQLISAQGSYSYKPYGGSVTMTSDYTQSFSYDNIGNMTSKVSGEARSPNLGTTALDYSHNYSYYSNAPHRAEVIGDMYYTYDGNGNLTEERLGGHRPEELRNTFEYTAPTEDVTKADQAWGWRTGDTPVDTAYSRQYEWDEENRLKKTTDPSHTTNYSYDHEGERSIKYSDLGETLYFDSLWLCTDVPGDSLRQTKNIYIGESRVASKISREGSDYSYERDHTFFYHADHLGSSNVVTDNDGNVYEHLEYTPYGETWIEDQSRDDFGMIPYHYTAVQKDEETGFTYHSARYMNPATSRWVSSDPAGWGLVNPMDEEFNIRGGFSIVESMNPYSYCSNNPINYRDPTGLDDEVDAITSAQPYNEPVPELGNVDANVSRQEAVDNIVFNSDSPINQHDLDNWYDFAENFDDSVSCQTAALINAYGSFMDVPKSVLDRVMAKSGNGLADAGWPTNPNKFSALLAKELGLPGALQYSGNRSDELLDYFAPGCEHSGIGIAMSQYTNSKTNITYTHFTTVIPMRIDSLNPYRGAASKYNIVHIRELVWRKFDE